MVSSRVNIVPAPPGPGVPVDGDELGMWDSNGMVEGADDPENFYINPLVYPGVVPEQYEAGACGCDEMSMSDMPMSDMQSMSNMPM